MFPNTFELASRVFETQMFGWGQGGVSNPAVTPALPLLVSWERRCDPGWPPGHSLGWVLMTPAGDPQAPCVPHWRKRALGLHSSTAEA